MMDMNSKGLGDNNLFINQKLRIKKRYTNQEILLHHYFFQFCNVYPKNIILINNFLFFFVESKDYLLLRSRKLLSLLRSLKHSKKILIICYEKILSRLLYNFFPDTYVHDISFHRNIYSGKKEIIIGFLSFIERGIAIGCKGEYIKAVNKLFEKYVIFDKDDGFPLSIKCKVVQLKSPRYVFPSNNIGNCISYDTY